jgi:hypothetical protein
LGFITALATSAHLSIFLSGVFVSGASDGTMMISTNGGYGWQSIVSPLPGAWVTSIAYDDVSGNIYAGLASNSNAGSPQTFYRSTDLGTSWQSVSAQTSGFPPVAVNSIVIDDKNDSIVIVGTDIGVYATRDIGASNISWEQLGAGLPHSAVVQLNLNRRTRTLRAATHGRDMWQFDLGAWERSTSVKEPVPESVALNLQAFPNPFTNMVTVSVSPSGSILAREIEFEIIDLNGTVQRMYTGNQQRVSFNISSLPSGIYFVHAQSGAWTAEEKILLVR